MTQAAKLRDALPAGTELNKDGMLDATGIPAKKIDQVLYAFVARGEILTREKNGETHYRINSDYKKSAGGGEAKSRKGKKPAAKRGAKAPKKTAGKKAKRPTKRTPRQPAHQGNGAALRVLALDNYLAACALLRATVAEQVEDIQDNSALAAALANHDRAQKLHAATL